MHQPRSRRGALSSVLFAAIAVLCVWQPAYADRAGTVALDLNYPGVGVRYFAQNQSAIEARGQFLGGTDLGGLRFYQYFTNEHLKPHGIDLFLGLEADYVSFKGGTSTSGHGAAGELFLGGEYYIGRRWSVQLDGGPAYMSVKDSGTSLGDSRFDVVVNFGINMYFGPSSSDDDSYSSSSRSGSGKAHNDEVTP